MWWFGRGFRFRGFSPPWPFVGLGRGGLPRCWAYLPYYYYYPWDPYFYWWYPWDPYFYWWYPWDPYLYYLYWWY